MLRCSRCFSSAPWCFCFSPGGTRSIRSSRRPTPPWPVYRQSVSTLKTAVAHDVERPEGWSGDWLPARIAGTAPRKRRCSRFQRWPTNATSPPYPSTAGAVLVFPPASRLRRSPAIWRMRESWPPRASPTMKPLRSPPTLPVPFRLIARRCPVRAAGARADRQRLSYALRQENGAY
jgi:hypothetical protein